MDGFNARDAINGIFAKVRFQMENELYNGMIAEHAGEMDVEEYTQLVTVISAFNKHGVSTKTLFDIMKELSATGGEPNVRTQEANSEAEGA